MPNPDYTAFKALDPFFAVVQQGLREYVDGEHYFDTIAADAVFEFRYHFPNYPRTVTGRSNLMSLYSGYGKNITLHRGDALVVHPSKDGRTVVLEYDIHGHIVATGVPYENRFISVVTVENRKITRWRDYMDSMAAWTALTSPSS